MTPSTVNRMDAELSEAEEKLVDCYRRLAETIQQHGDQLPPFARRNALKALAALWQVANGLDMDPGELYHLGA